MLSIMILNLKNGLLYFKFENLAGFDDINHAVFTRINGFSRGCHEGLNLSHSVGDETNHVNGNRDTVERIMGWGTIVFAHQVHQSDILIINSIPIRKGSPVHQESLTGDGLVTATAGAFVAVKLADCQAVMMYDPVKKAAANVHSGWRGSIQNIISRCIEIMKQQFNTNPEDIVAGISPSLGPCCSEFIHYKNEIPKKYWQYKDDRQHFNFWAMSRDQLASSGVRPENIETAGICTKCNSHLFYSYRQSKNSGRFAAVIGIRIK
jgi:polyphenol oxidase